MHYCLMLFAKQKKTEEEIEKILEKYQDVNIPNGEYPQFEWDWFEIGGRWNKSMKTQSGSCNMAFVEEIKDFENLDCYTFMTPDGEAYSRKWWNGDDFIPNDDFEEKLKSAKDKAREENQFVTIIDYHD